MRASTSCQIVVINRGLIGFDTSYGIEGPRQLRNLWVPWVPAEPAQQRGDQASQAGKVGPVRPLLGGHQKKKFCHGFGPAKPSQRRTPHCEPAQDNPICNCCPRPRPVTAHILNFNSATPSTLLQPGQEEKGAAQGRTQRPPRHRRQGRAPHHQNLRRRRRLRGRALGQPGPHRL